MSGIRLTDLQRKVLREVAKGKSDKEIAKKLKYSLSGVNYHMRALFNIFNVDNRTKLACTAIKEGLI
jgi:DNA-binding NarL/FixJ family response regulator